MTEPEKKEDKKTVDELDKMMRELVAKCEETLIDSYTAMIARPFEMLGELIKEEHFHAAAIVIKRLEREVVDFRVKLENARNERMRILAPPAPEKLVKPEPKPEAKPPKEPPPKDPKVTIT